MRARLFKTLIEPMIVVAVTRDDGKEAQHFVRLSEDEFASLTDELLEKISEGVDTTLIFATDSLTADG